MFLDLTPDPNNRAIGPRKVQNDPKIRQNQDQEIELLLENKCCYMQCICIGTKKIFGHHPSPEKSPIGPKKAQNFTNKKIQKITN